MFSFICAWINRWVNNREDDGLRRHHTHCDVTVMSVRRQTISSHVIGLILPEYSGFRSRRIITLLLHLLNCLNLIIMSSRYTCCAHIDFAPINNDVASDDCVRTTNIAHVDNVLDHHRISIIMNLYFELWFRLVSYSLSQKVPGQNTLRYMRDILVNVNWISI